MEKIFYIKEIGFLSQTKQKTNTKHLSSLLCASMAMAQKITTKPHDPKVEFPSRFSQSSYEYGGPKVYTVKEATNTTSCGRVMYLYPHDQSTIRIPIAPHSTEHIQYFRNPNRFERPKERDFTCEEAFKRYGGVLIKEFRN
ncbi:hypothetical protein V5N11_008767 [Cardamine amara subsp. amara]|uniref:Uncharacterized protein n=1 Tax=Cardamine amara subsp. amara TaxID=228776 RepID=A0ABD0ZH64_CARAN